MLHRRRLLPQPLHGVGLFRGRIITGARNCCRLGRLGRWSSSLTTESLMGTAKTCCFLLSIRCKNNEAMRSADLSRRVPFQGALTGQASMAHLAPPDGKNPYATTRSDKITEQLVRHFHWTLTVPLARGEYRRPPACQICGCDTSHYVDTESLIPICPSCHAIHYRGAWL